MSMPCKLSSACALLATLLLTRVLLAQSLNADLILLHGHILTADASDSVAQAIAIRHGIIIKVGTDAEVLAIRGQCTRDAHHRPSRTHGHAWPY